MRILFDHQAFSAQRYGGISRYFHELMRGLSRNPDAEVELTLRYTENAYIQADGSGPLRGLSRLPGVTERLRFLTAYLVDRQWAARRLRRPGYDLFHPTFYDAYFLRHVQTPYVLTVMDCIPERFPELFPRNTIYGRFVTGQWIDNKKRLVQSAARVIAISETTKADVVRFYGISPDKVDVVYLANSLPKDCRAQGSQTGESVPYVLFVGSRWGYKNFTAFVHAMQPVLEAHPKLWVLCVGGGRFTERECRLIDDSGAAGRYVQRNLEEAELAEAYSAAAAFVFPSLWEGFGLPIVEAFGCGCPCVLSRSSCFPEIAGDAAEYFDPRQIRTITTAINSVIDEPSRRQALVERGFTRVQKFGWQATATQTFQVYSKALSGS